MEVYKVSGVSFKLGAGAVWLLPTGTTLYIVHCTLYMDCIASCDYVIAVYGTAALAAVCWVCVFAAVRTRVGTVRWSFELGLGVSATGLVFGTNWRRAWTVLAVVVMVVAVVVLLSAVVLL
jgi:hypothetical protein